MGLLNAMMAIRPQQALNGPQLSGIRRADPAAPAQAVARLLGYVDSMFNFADNKRFNTAQVSLLANEIVSDYWYLKFDEVVYVLRQGAKGKYHTFDRIDAGVIHGWFNEYLVEREALVAAAAQEEARLHRLAEQATRKPRYANEHEVRAYLNGLSDDELLRGIDYYQRNPSEAQAAIKLALATEVLLDRKKMQMLKNAVGQPDETGHTFAEELSEEDYRRYRAEWVANRAHDTEDASEESARPEAA